MPGPANEISQDGRSVLTLGRDEAVLRNIEMADSRLDTKIHSALYGYTL